jgi:hypothetical protein
VTEFLEFEEQTHQKKQAKVYTAFT